MEDYDVFVIGTGSAGSSVASICNRAGLKTAIADNRPYGGTCSQRGCNPKKLLVSTAEIVDKSRKMKDKGIRTASNINWEDLINYKNSIIKNIPQSSEENYENSGIDTFHGKCSFKDENTIKVEESKTVTADKIVIATGARPMPLNIEGEKYLTTSDAFLNIKDLPEKIVFVGGGYISFEFSHVVNRAGSEAVILNDTERPLVNFEEFVVDELLEATRDIGIDVKLNSRVVSIEKENDEYKVKTKSGDEYKADLVVHGAGRIPALDALNLEKGNIERDKKGVVIGDNLQSVSNPDVYVAGDANGRGIPLTPIASMEGYVVGHNISRDHDTRPVYKGVPSVVFTLPPLASVGLSEKEAKDSDKKYKISSGAPETWFYTKLHGYKSLAYKILVEEDTGKILGAHLLGYNSDEVINMFS
ncbi:MAG: dihydrolipoyl dehydrogenase family protein, partial [Elusimicrobiota bacterium]